MTTLKEALEQLAKGHELDNEQKKLIIDKWQKELGIQPCEDCISREKLIKDLNFLYNENGFIKDTRAKRTIEVIMGQAPVTPQPDTARRIVGKSRGGMTLWYQCETCNEPVDERDTFCRGCGRRLVE